MSNNQEDWRKVMLAQYTIFGTVASLEITALAIIASFSEEWFILSEKIIFSITAFLLFCEVVLLLWLINQERKVAFGDSMQSFQENEKTYRSAMILLMVVTWGLLLSLLLVKVW